jgi:hypothetical protein
MRGIRTTLSGACLSLSLVAAAAGPAVARGQAPPPSPMIEGHESDDYTRYELLAPGTGRFRIAYEVTATEPGARFYFNPIRKGSQASDEAVYDRMTGQRLTFEVVDASAAAAAGLKRAEADTRYIQVTLPRPVPAGGEVRLLIDKTYFGPASYVVEGDMIVFSRPLGVKRNAVVMPAGYEIVACNVPSQVLRQPDGRVMVSFFNIGPGEAPLVVRARRLPAPPPGAPGAWAASPAAPAHSSLPPVSAEASSLGARLSERARQDREIVYFLQQPETHAFSLYHDYTEAREGIDKYLNVVRAGSRVSAPSARLLDTGEPLGVQTLRGAQVTAARLDIGEPVTADTEVVVVRFPPVVKGQSIRLRIIETYTDPARYRLDGDLLIFDRSLGRPRNAVVLPAGWYLTDSAIPAVVTMTSDGRVRLDYDNPRPDELNVLVRAARRPR